MWREIIPRGQGGVVVVCGAAWYRASSGCFPSREVGGVWETTVDGAVRDL